MTTSTIRLMHCDFPGCTAQAPKESGYTADRLDGWTDAIYTHGCPDHGDLINAHRADLYDRTTGRGYREKTYWYLTCACGWSPRPNGITHNSGPLKAAHLAHLREQAA